MHFEQGLRNVCEDAFHGISADVMAHVGESPTNPLIAPA